MSIYGYEAAFGSWDKTSKAMRDAQAQWLRLYYGTPADGASDPCQRVAYTVVSKLTKAVFGEYLVSTPDPAAQAVVQALDKLRTEAFGQALVGGECYIKPCPHQAGFSFTLIPRSNVLIFGRAADGTPTDIGTVEKTVRGEYYYTLLERRTLENTGYLTIENRLYRSRSSQSLGTQVPLSEHPAYGHLLERHTYTRPMGSVGLVRMKTPMVNCVDSSPDGVSVYAAAAGLIENIDRNEFQMNGEFQRGESRIIASADLLRKDPLGNRSLDDHLFVGVDEDPETVGITVYSPQLREQSFLARKQEYLRNVESIIGLRRGMLSDANMEDRTATEITSSAGDFNLTVLELQRMWADAVQDTVDLCAVLAKMFRLEVPRETRISIDWGNGILYDEEQTWAEYVQMVKDGLLKPELALGWRFGMAADTREQQAAIREKYMPSGRQDPV